MAKPATKPKVDTSPAKAKSPSQAIIRAGRQQRHPRRTQGLLPRHAADPPLRGAGGPALRHGSDRRLLPPLHRPGGRCGRRSGERQTGPRQDHHRLSRPRPYAVRGHGPERGHGRADRPHRRLSSKGKGGSMHMFDTATGFYGGHGIVGAQVALGARVWPSPVASRGDDRTWPLSILAMARPTRARSMRAFNMAQLWKLPAIYIIENNQYAMGTSIERSSSTTDAERARASLRHSGRTGRRHGCAGRARPRAPRPSSAPVKAGKGPLHPRDEDLSLPRPLDVGSGQIPGQGRGRRGQERPATRSTMSARCCWTGRRRPRTTSRPSTPRSRHDRRTRRSSSPRKAPSRIRPSSGPTFLCGGLSVTDILMPALSPTMEEGTLTKWHIKAGDTVQVRPGHRRDRDRQGDDGGRGRR